MNEVLIGVAVTTAIFFYVFISNPVLRFLEAGLKKKALHL